LPPHPAGQRNIAKYVAGNYAHDDAVALRDSLARSKGVAAWHERAERSAAARPAAAGPGAGGAHGPLGGGPALWDPEATAPGAPGATGGPRAVELAVAAVEERRERLRATLAADRANWERELRGMGLSLNDA